MEQLAPLMQLIQKDLPSVSSEPFWIQEDSYTLDELKDALTRRIELYLEQDMEGLIQMAYRIDLPEAAFDWVLSQGDAAGIADLIIQRELQKLAFRQRYNSR